MFHQIALNDNELLLKIFLGQSTCQTLSSRVTLKVNTWVTSHARRSLIAGDGDPTCKYRGGVLDHGDDLGSVEAVGGEVDERVQVKVQQVHEVGKVIQVGDDLYLQQRTEMTHCIFIASLSKAFVALLLRPRVLFRKMKISKRSFFGSLRSRNDTRFFCLNLPPRNATVRTILLLLEIFMKMK